MSKVLYQAKQVATVALGIPLMILGWVAFAIVGGLVIMGFTHALGWMLDLLTGNLH